MTDILSKRLILVLMLTVVDSLVAISSRYRSPLLLRSSSVICPTPYFPNGMIRLRLRGKFLLFNCKDEFTLVGSKYISCRNGRWNSPAPICVKPGCPELTEPEQGFINYEHEKATATLFCRSGYQLAGSKYSYCNGTDWDRKIGNCRKTGLEVAIGCDFETSDWCGWENEAVHNVGWIRSAGVISKRALKTGPRHDHTTGEPMSGHFLMVDSSQQFTNDTAHLISPVYSANYSVNACFRFYYHMFGDSVGALVVYVKPQSVALKDMLRENAYFSVNGSHGNAWNEAYFDLQRQNESFQIIFEATMGYRYKSDIAVDDVDLLFDQDCEQRNRTSLSAPSVTDEPEPVFKIDSCENRCGMNSSQLNETNDGNVIHCECTEECADRETCCPDYIERCIFPTSTATVWDFVTLSLASTTESIDAIICCQNETAPTQSEHSSNNAQLPSALLVLAVFVVIVGVILIVVRVRHYSRLQIISWVSKGRYGCDGSVDAMEDMRFLHVNDETN